MSKGFIFRFKSEDQRKEFKILAINLNKSMNELLGEIVTQYLSEINKEVTL